MVGVDDDGSVVGVPDPLREEERLSQLVLATSNPRSTSIPSWFRAGIYAVTGLTPILWGHTAPSPKGRTEAMVVAGCWNSSIPGLS